MHWPTGLEGFPDFEDVGPRHHGWQREASQEANNFFMKHCRVASSLLLPALSSGRKVVLSLDSRFLVAPRRHTLASSHKCSTCSCFGASPCPCLPLSVPAGVAVSLTALATTVQRSWRTLDRLWPKPSSCCVFVCVWRGCWFHVRFVRSCSVPLEPPFPGPPFPRTALPEDRLWLKLKVGFFCISSKPYTTFSHGAQGMACSRHSRWLGPDHSWTPAEISPMASSIATTSICRPWPVTPATKAEPTRCEDVRHSPVWRSFSEGHGSPGTGDQVGVRSGSSGRCGGSRSRQSPHDFEAGQGG